MLEYYFYGAELRLAQVIIYSSLWLVIGYFIAAIFRQMLGPAKIRKLFGEGTRRGILTGWLIGMLLPVCSLGVIPIVRELYRSGVKGGTIIAFALTAPLFNPMSVLYGLTLSDPIAILSFSLCALVIVSLLGMLWDRFFPTLSNSTIKEKVPTPGIKRSAAVFYSAAREATGVSAIFVLIGILCSVLTAVGLDKGFLQNEVERDNWLAPIAVAFVALPIYSTPLLAMSQIGGMFQHGNSIGAAFSLLILGAGANIGMFAWFVMATGWKRTLLFLTLLITITVTLAYAIDKPLYPAGVDPAGHTHAFDVYTHPFHKSESDLAQTAHFKIAEFWQVNEFGGTYLLAGITMLGLVIRGIGPARIEPWFYSPSGKRGRNIDIEVPSWALGGAVVCGLVVASIAGCFLYYPSPGELLPDMTTVNTECVLSAKNQDWEAAEKWIQFNDDLSRRLEVGVFLRNGLVGEFQKAKAQTFRDKLDVLRHAVEEKDTTNIQELAFDVDKAYRRLSQSYRDAYGENAQQ